MLSSPEVHVLVRAEESHELRHLDDFNLTGSVDVEVAPGLGEVSIKVTLQGSTGQVLVGLEDFASGSSGIRLSHHERSIGGTILVLMLDSVLLDHASHEDVVGVGRESTWGNSLVSALALHGVLMWVEEFARVVDLIVLEKLLLFKLNSSIVWVSSIGSLGGVLAIVLLNGLVISVVLHGSKRPDWLLSGSKSQKEGNSNSVFHFNYY